jgi:hypothetical protein
MFGNILLRYTFDTPSIPLRFIVSKQIQDKYGGKRSKTTRKECLTIKEFRTKIIKTVKA